jgi:hypothetical protein
LILNRIPQAKFLALTSQVEDMRSLTKEFGIPRSRCLVTSIGYERIHRWLPWIDFGLMLRVSSNQANRASMPTKLAEFFASGVAPIDHGANSEVVDWVSRTGSGLGLDDLSIESLERAAEFVAGGTPDFDVLVRARRAAEHHFSLDSGAARYDTLFQTILS